MDCMVDIPNVNSFPVLTVQTMPPVSEPLYSTLMQRYTKPKGTKLDYEFRSNDYQTVITQADPSGWDEKAGEIPGKVTERWHSLLKYDMNSAYGNFLREKGSYYLYCTQKFHGIPFLAPIAAGFVNFGNMPRMLYTWRERGIIYTTIYDQESFSLCSYAWQETSVLYDNVTLLSFDQVKPKLEELILSGNIRYIYHVGLGYVQYCSSQNGDGPYTLVPAYVAWCEYCNSAKAELNASKDEGSDIFLGNGQNFQPIIINAQTGEVHDNQSTDYSLAVTPKIIK